MQQYEGLLSIRVSRDNWIAGEIAGKKVAGVLPLGINDGDYVKADGTIIYHPTFGEQLKITNCQKIIPTNLDGFAKYLARTFTGIGFSKAKKIVDKFGIDFLETLEKNPQQILETKIINEQVANSIQEQWKKEKHNLEINMFFSENDITPTLQEKIISAYAKKLSPKKIIQKIKENPYCLATDVDGIGFKKADIIATKLNIQFDDPRRINAAILFVLETMAKNDGHCFVNTDTLLQETNSFLNLNQLKTIEIIKQLNKLEAKKLIKIKTHCEQQIIILQTFNKAEQIVADKIKKLCLQPETKLDIEIFKKFEMWNILSDEQKQAITNSLTKPISIITGGPGVGKTTIIYAITNYIKNKNMSFELAAPTGKAAKRMAEQTGESASTIHRMLNYSPFEGWGYNKNNPLNTDYVIVDECSMIDIKLASRLLDGINTQKTKIIFVGDIDQLPPVGPGYFFRDLIKSKENAVSRLTKIYRQDETSAIALNAHAINTGSKLIVDNKKSFFYIKTEANEMLSNVQQIVTKLLKEHKIPMEEIQILAPMKKTIAGVNSLNQMLSNNFNKIKTEIKGTDFKIGDKIIQKKNNYKRTAYSLNSNENLHGLFNGDTGIITKKTGSKYQILFYDEYTSEYTIPELNTEIMLAWALTIHKAQGSEYEAVIIPIHTGEFIMLQRNLLYTAVTRAKRFVFLLSDNRATHIAISNNIAKKRNTLLQERLTQTTRI